MMMRITSKLSALLIPALLLSSIPSCKRLRAPQSLEAIDQIDRRENVPMTQPAVARDLAQIWERGTLVVLAPYNSTTYFIYRGEPLLLGALNEWIEDKQQKNNSLFDRLYKKYFVDWRAHVERVGSEYLTSSTDRLCPFDELLKRHSATPGWDWRLLAAQTYQESRFKPDARSWAGATGLLQLMPPTAREFGVRNPLDPEDNVQGACKFLKWLTDYWTERIPDEGERLKFILASYNTGAGHVEDAQRLTEKYGGNPEKWDDVSYWLLQKSTQQYSTDPVVKFGFCRGLEPVNYVSHILERFEHYKQYLAAYRADTTLRLAARSAHAGDLAESEQCRSAPQLGIGLPALR
jgi:membrane-bound lytic murein transglycosylase MltF